MLESSREIALKPRSTGSWCNSTVAFTVTRGARITMCALFTALPKAMRLEGYEALLPWRIDFASNWSSSFKHNHYASARTGYIDPLL